jgi:outer membrane protein, multidrug efflux system
VQYREGVVDFQRVLDSQRALFSQQERLVAKKGGIARNLISLYKAMAGGWKAGTGARLQTANASAMPLN